MDRGILRSLVAAMLATLLLSSPAAAEFRISYAEPAIFSFAAISPGASKPGAARKIALRAFDRRFDLVLEGNDGLLRDLSRVPTGVALLKGSIEGVADSWVRLTVIDGRYDGVFWDGVELYAIELPERISPYLSVAPPSSAGTPLIYRLSDTQGVLPENFCGVKGSPGHSGSVIASYKRLVHQLKTAVTLTGARDIEVSMVADSNFAREYGNGAMNELIRRMNVVDGIFDSQVGVNIVPTDFRIFAAADDPFTSSNAELLLTAVGNYRESTPTVRARGLTHLISGLNLDGSTVGIAYLDSLCDVRNGTSLSENQGAVLSSSLIIAHELGHSFGAEHDGEEGSTCATTPATYLMSSYMNGSSTFSQCSITMMQSSAASAACVTPARTRDIAVSVASASVPAVINEPFNYVADISALGQGDSHNIVVSAAFSSDFRVLSGNLPGASCRTTTQSVFCELSELTAGTTNQLSIRLQPMRVGRSDTWVSVDASNDSLTSNNRVDVSIQTYATVDASVTATPSIEQPIVRQPFDVNFDITARGSQDIADAIARIDPFRVQVLNVTSANGTCTNVAAGWSCALGPISPGQARRVTVRVVADSIDYARVVLSLHSGSSTTSLASAGFDLNARPEFDLRLAGLPSGRIVTIGDWAEIPVTVTSAGTAAVPDARLIIGANDARIARQFAAANVICSPSGTNLECNLGTLAPGATINGTLRVSASEAVESNVWMMISESTLDDNRGNSGSSMHLSVRPGSDISVDSAWRQTFQLYDARPAQFFFSVHSKGATTPTDVVVTMDFPETFSISAATYLGASGTCSVTARRVTCTAPSLPGSAASIGVTMTASSTGLHQATLTVAAGNDAVATNNTRTYDFNVRPFVDAAVIVPPTIHVLVGTPVDVPITIRNGNYSLADASVTLGYGPSIVVEALSAGQGSCTQQTAQIVCQLGTLAAGASVPINLRLRWTQRNSGVTVRLQSPYDVSSENNQPTLSFLLDDPGDAALRVGSTTVSAVTGTGLVLPGIEVTATAATRDVFIEIDFDPTRLSNPSASGLSGAECNWARPARCTLSGLPDESWTKTFGVIFTAGAVGSSSVTIRVGARNDTNPSNDVQTVTAVVEAAPPVTPPPTTPPPGSGGGTSGGGGGGDFGFVGLLLLLGLLGLRIQTRQRASD